jgi:flagellar hook-length control protein FliK
MNTEISVLPAKSGVDGPASNGGKVKSGDSTSFGKVLQDVKNLNDVKATKPLAKEDDRKSDVINQLEQVIQFFTGSLDESTGTIPPKIKAELQKLVGLLKTLKGDLQKGNAAVSTDVSLLLKSLNELTKSVQHKDGTFQKDPLQQLFDDFKKKPGTDIVTFFQSVVQAIFPSMTFMKSGTSENKDIAQSMDPLVKTKNNTISLQHMTNSQQKDAVKATHPQPNHMTTSADGKVVVDKADQKTKMTVIGQPAQEKKQSMSGQGEGQSQQTDKLKTSQWIAGGPINKVQQFILHSAPKAQSPGVQVLNHVREVISKGIIKPLPDGGLELTIKLHPANLGTVQVVLSQHAGGLQASIIAQSQTTKDLLQSQLSQLKQTFATLGINVQKIDVGQFNQAQSQQQNPSQFNGQAFQQSGGDGRDGQRQNGDDSRQVDNDFYDLEPESTFNEWLREGGMI